MSNLAFLKVVGEIKSRRRFENGESVAVSTPAFADQKYPGAEGLAVAIGKQKLVTMAGKGTIVNGGPGSKDKTTNQFNGSCDGITAASQLFPTIDVPALIEGPNTEVGAREETQALTGPTPSV